MPCSGEKQFIIGSMDQLSDKRYFFEKQAYQNGNRSKDDGLKEVEKQAVSDMEHLKHGRNKDPVEIIDRHGVAADGFKETAQRAPFSEKVLAPQADNKYTGRQQQTGKIVTAEKDIVVSLARV